MSSTEIAPPPRPGPADYQVAVARTAAETEALRSDWEMLNLSPNAQIDFFTMINSVRPSVVRPHVIALRQHGEIKGVVVARVVEKEFTCSLGYKTFRIGRVRQMDVVHRGLLGVCGQGADHVVIGELLGALQRREVDVVNLSQVRADSGLFGLAREAPGFCCRDRLRITQLHRKARLPGTLDEFLGRLSKKHRSWARRMEKLLHTDFKEQVRFKSFEEYADLEQLAHDLEAVSEKTYQHGLGAGFIRNSEQRERLALGRRRGWLRGIVLHVNDRPCAFWIGSVYKGVFFSEGTGFDPEFRKYEVGTQVFLKLVEKLCREGVKEIDFGLGDALYKQRFGDECWEEGSVYLFAPSLKGKRLNLVRTALEGPALAARRTLTRLGWEQRMKTFWRRKLAGGQKS